MPLSTKIIVFILAGFAAAGAGLYGLYQGTDLFDRPRVAEETAPAVDTADGPAAGAPAATAPSFDIVRVEPTGEIVAAGQSSETARVELLVADDLLAGATANATGEWALVSDRPLAPGSYELLVRATGPGGEGDMVEGDRLTVVIEAPDRSPLVAITRPGTPTQVVQQPEEQDEAPAVVAEAPPAEQPESGPGATGETVTVSPPQSADAGAAAAPPADGSQAPAAAAAGRPDTGSDAPATAEASDAAETDAPGEQIAGQPASPEGEAASAEPAAQQPADTGPMAPAESQVAAADTTDAGPEPSASEGTAAGEAEPAPAQTAETAGDAAVAADQAPPAAAAAGEDAAAPQVTIETVEVEEPATLLLGGRADAGSAVRVYLNNERLADMRAGEGGRWGATLDHDMPPGRYEVRADVVGPSGDVLARAEVRFDRVRLASADEPAPADAGGTQSGSAVTIVARGTQGGQVAFGGAPGAEGETSVILISRGDNLWRIARKIYGKGIRHTVIYEANKNQIRNPHRIYPGQVFTIPVLEDEAQPNG